MLPSSDDEAEPDSESNSTTPNYPPSIILHVKTCWFSLRPFLNQRKFQYRCNASPSLWVQLATVGDYCWAISELDERKVKLHGFCLGKFPEVVDRNVLGVSLRWENFRQTQKPGHSHEECSPAEMFQDFSNGSHPVGALLQHRPHVLPHRSLRCSN